MVPWHAVLPARYRVQLVPAEDHAPVLALAVDEVVRVAETGHLARQFVARDGLERDVLVVDRRRRDESPNHRGDLRRPHPGGVDDDLRVDGPGVGQDAADLAPGRHLEPGHADALPDPDAEGTGGVGHGVGRPVRVQVAVARQMNRPVQLVRGDGRHQPAGLLRPDDLSVQADPARPAGGPLQLAELFPRGRQAQAAHPLEHPELFIQRNAVPAEGHHRRGRVERGHEPRGLAGGTGGKLVLLDEQHVRPAGERQVVGDAAAGDPAPDDHDPRLVHAHDQERYVEAWRRVRSLRTRRSARLRSARDRTPWPDLVHRRPCGP